MHRYLVRLENVTSYSPKDTMNLLISLRRTADQFGSVVKNLRISETAIEFDLYVPNQEKKEKTISRLESEIGKKTSERDLETDEISPLDKEKVVRESVNLFNEQRYWECHETLEQIWRIEPKGPEREIQQGIILAASALVHFQKNENDVCLRMIPRAFSKLERWLAKDYYAIDVDRLKSELKNIERTKVIRPFKL